MRLRSPQWAESVVFAARTASTLSRRPHPPVTMTSTFDLEVRQWVPLPDEAADTIKVNRELALIYVQHSGHHRPPKADLPFSFAA